ncbi:restriction endonuclease subunit S [Clostridium tetani]|uniref:restriction endonuclease subunit S n=1 Tax=Clostridium tetani TaxID=1513 RepID=UPI002953BFF5|nr:restriction endonuclease subunit S [Clostridium tetani]
MLFKLLTYAWEQRKLGDVFVKLQNNSLSRAQLNYEQGIANNVHYGDILITFGECLDVRKEQLPYINNDTLVDKYRTSFLKNGDIIFADAAEDETVGKCTEILGLTTQIVISGLHTIPCRPIQSFANGYLGYYLNSNAYHNQLLPLMQGTKVSSISRSSLDETYVIYPKSKEEQMQIGLFFKELDNLITLHQRKVNFNKLKGGISNVRKNKED